MSRLASKLGKLYASIWCAHDRKQYKLIEKNYIKICDLLGIPKKKSKLVSNHVMMSYIKADIYSNKPELYSQCLREFISARRILEINDEISNSQIKWWINFRQKRYLSATYFIFIQQLRMFHKINANTLLSTYYFVQSGFAHNKRNEKMMAKWLTKYWECFLEEFPDRKKIPLPI